MNISSREISDAEKIIASNPIEFATELQQLLEKFLDAKSRRDQLSKEIVEYQKVGRPKPLSVVTDIQQYVDFIRAKMEFVARRDQIKSELDEAEKTFKTIQSELVNLLPYKVWFKVGDLAVGVAYSDWGGSHWYIETEEWSETLKGEQLDHTYRE